MAVFSSCAVLDTLVFFIRFARCASTVLTLVLSRWPISLFLKPAHISSRISCSRLVNDSGRFLRGGGSRSTREDLDLSRVVRAIFAVLLMIGRRLRYNPARKIFRRTFGPYGINSRNSSSACKSLRNGPSETTYSIIARNDLPVRII